MTLLTNTLQGGQVRCSCIDFTNFTSRSYLMKGHMLWAFVWCAWLESQNQSCVCMRVILIGICLLGALVSSLVINVEGVQGIIIRCDKWGPITLFTNLRTIECASLDDSNLLAWCIVKQFAKEIGPSSENDMETARSKIEIVCFYVNFIRNDVDLGWARAYRA